MQRIEQKRRKGRSEVGCLMPGIIIFIIIASIIILFSLFIFFGRMMNPNSPPRNAAVQMEVYFQRDKELFMIVRDYFITRRQAYNVDSIFIQTNDEAHLTSLGCVEVVDALRVLGDRRYSVVQMRNDFISFQRWSNLDAGWGALYLMNVFPAEPLSVLPTVEILEPLSGVGWHFYISR